MHSTKRFSSERLVIAALGGLFACTAHAQMPAPEAVPPAPMAPTPHPAHPPAAGTNNPAANPADVDPPASSTTRQRSTEQQSAGTDPEPGAVRAVTDFVNKAGEDGLAEVQLGHLALSKSQNARVRDLAQQIIDDHDQTNAALSAVAAMKNVSMPKSIDAEHQRQLQTLGGKQGRAFDTAYVDQTIAAHTRAITLFTAAAGQSDSEVAAFAYKALPALKTHRKMAESLKTTGKAMS